MKEKSKISTIARAFLGTEQLVSDDILKFRKEQCASCPYNSKNTKDLSIADMAKRKLGEFCTLCGCFIDKKITQPNEVCAMEMINEKPKWNKIMIETVSKDSFDLINNSSDVMNVKLSENKEEFILDFGTMDAKKGKNHIFGGNFELVLPTRPKAVVEYVGVSCDCTKPKSEMKDGKLNVDLVVDIGYKPQFPKKVDIKKSIFVYYQIKGDRRKLTINIDGVIRWI